MSKRPPGAPRPKEKHVGLLDDTIVILSATDPTKDQIPEFQRALGTLDELLDAIRHFDSNTFPEGFARRLTNARRELNEGAQRPLELRLMVLIVLSSIRKAGVPVADHFPTESCSAPPRTRSCST